MKEAGSETAFPQMAWRQSLFCLTSPLAPDQELYIQYRHCGEARSAGETGIETMFQEHGTHED